MKPIFAPYYFVAGPDPNRYVHDLLDDSHDSIAALVLERNIPRQFGPLVFAKLYFPDNSLLESAIGYQPTQGEIWRN